MTEEEIRQLQSYLTAQSMRRTPLQIMEALQEVYRQFTATVAGLADDRSLTGDDGQVWSVLELLEHISLFMSSYTAAICAVLERGERPPDVEDRQEILPNGKRTREELLSSLDNTFQLLALTVSQADPDSNLALTWRHFELGAMHWRQWLLFARVHLLDHVRQVEAAN